MQFQQDWPKDKKNDSSLIFFKENLEKFRAKICNFSKIGAKYEKYQLSQEENSRRNCQEATRRTGDMAKCLPNKWEIRYNRRKAGLSSERKAQKPF